jgi:hypothetical protein
MELCVNQGFTALSQDEMEIIEGGSGRVNNFV